MTFSPARFTPALSEDFPSDADWLLPILEVAWKTADNPEFALEPWQVELLRRTLELYPEGHPRAGELRYRQVVISMGRQNGKSTLAAAYGLWGLLRAPGQLVIGIASSADQARIVYDRTMHVIRSNKSLAALFDRLTDTRGIKSKDGGKYEIKASQSLGALQGLSVSLGICDELHILRSSAWFDLVNGTGGRSNGLVIGITTAGDDHSELLKALYSNGEKALAGDEDFERFGFFVWEASEAVVPQSNDELARELKAANPSIASGRIDLDNVLGDIKAMPEPDVIRYRLNRFVQSTNSFINASSWAKCERPHGAQFPRDGRVVFAVDRTPDWAFATITVAYKDAEDITHTEVVASLVKPNLSQLVNVVQGLSRHSPAAVIVDGYALRDLGKELQRRGLPVVITTMGDVLNASSLFYAKIMQQKISHAGDPLLSVQLPRTVRKNVGEQFRISRQDSSVEIDAVISTMLAVWGSETRLETSLQVF